jgi:hypothetical protein
VNVCVPAQTVGSVCDAQTGLCVCKGIFLGQRCEQRQLIENSLFFAYGSLIAILVVILPLLCCTRALSTMSIRMTKWMEPNANQQTQVQAANPAPNTRSKSRRHPCLWFLQLIGVLVMLAFEFAGNVVRVLANAWLLNNSLVGVRWKTPSAVKELAESLAGALTLCHLPLGWLVPAVFAIFTAIGNLASRLSVSANVTCDGSTLPFHLFGNFVLIVLTVLMIESHVELATGSKTRLLLAGRQLLVLPLPCTRLS